MNKNGNLNNNSTIKLKIIFTMREMRESVLSDHNNDNNTSELIINSGYANQELSGDTNQDPNITKPGISRQDKYGLTVLFILYFIQGLPSGFAGTIYLNIIQNKASNYQLSIFTLHSYAFPLKCIFAPFLDAYYFKSFGKRKTYLIPLLYIFGVFSLIFSNYIDEMVTNVENVEALTIDLFLQNVIICTQYIALDGWVITLISPDVYRYGAVARFLGLNCGTFISYNILVPLSSLTFCNKYLYSTPQTVPWINLSEFQRYSSIFIIIVTFLIQIFVKETNPKTNDVRTVCQMISLVKNVYTNKNVRYLFLLYIVSRVGFGPLDAAFNTTLIHEGLPSYVFVNISTAIFPLQFIALPLIGKLAVKNREFTIWWFIYGFYIIKYISMYLVIYFINPVTNYTLVVIAIFIQHIEDTILGNGQSICQGALHNRIADPDVAGTFFTYAYTAITLGSDLPNTISLSLNNLLSWKIAGIIGICFSIVFMLIFRKKVIKLTCQEKEEFALVKHQNQVEDIHNNN